MELRSTLSSPFVVAVLAAMLAGCATSSGKYQSPQRYGVQNTKLTKLPFDAAWDRLVKNLSSDFFVINNIDKHSRLLNISFSASRPSEFVDCGTSTRIFNKGFGEEKTTFPTADPAVYGAANSAGAPFTVRQTTRLEGRANIYVAPEGDATQIVVNARYVLTVNTQARNAEGHPVGSDQMVYDFSTKLGGGANEVLCYTKGVIERRILSFVD